MQIYYDSERDLLYLRFDPRTQELCSERVAEDIVLDIGEDDRIVGIEILEASLRINLPALLPRNSPGRAARPSPGTAHA